MKNYVVILIGMFVFIGCADKEALRREAAIKAASGSGGEQVIDPWEPQVMKVPARTEGVAKIVDGDILVSSAYYSAVPSSDVHYELRGKIDGVSMSWAHGPTIDAPNTDGWFDLGEALVAAKPGIYDLKIVGVSTRRRTSGFYATDVVESWPAYRHERDASIVNAPKFLHCTSGGLGDTCTVRIEIASNRNVVAAADRPTSEESLKLTAEIVQVTDPATLNREQVEQALVGQDPELGQAPLCDFTGPDAICSPGPETAGIGESTESTETAEAVMTPIALPIVEIAPEPTQSEPRKKAHRRHRKVRHR